MAGTGVGTMTRARDAALVALVAGCLGFLAFFLIVAYAATMRAMYDDRAILVGSIIAALVSILLAGTFAIVAFASARHVGSTAHYDVPTWMKVLFAVDAVAIAVCAILVFGGFVEGIVP